MKPLGHVTAVIALSSVGTAASAQPDEGRVTPYAWIAGYDGSVGAPGTGSGLIGRALTAPFIGASFQF